MSRWVTCTDCNRVLLAEHGPTCPECLAKRVLRGEPVAHVYGEPEIQHKPGIVGRIKIIDAEEPPAE